MDIIADACELLSASQKVTLANNYFRSIADNADSETYYISKQGREMVLYLLAEDDHIVVEVMDQWQ
jgi:hypothetical protein